MIGLADEVVVLDGVAIVVVDGEIDAVVEAGMTRGRMSSSTSFIGNGIAAFSAAPCGNSPCVSQRDRPPPRFLLITLTSNRSNLVSISVTDAVNGSGLIEEDCSVSSRGGRGRVNEDVAHREDEDEVPSPSPGTS